ncbi:MAG: U32 family peptidase [Halofilum sp. (in: g-proteobacteria)]
MAAPGLSVGPLLYLWSREETVAFYEALADAPVDVVYLGETVCAKRRALGPDDWIALGRELVGAGKEVVLSTLTLIEARSELATVRRLCANGVFTVEANDFSAVQQCVARQVEFVGGPALNLYNAESLALLVNRGLRRWVPPVEMSKDSLEALMRDWDELDTGPIPETEIFALGRMPLAWSARCFAARAHRRPKDDCGFVCGQYPGGMEMDTQEGEYFLTLNGIQTQSGRPVNLFPRCAEMAELGVALLRVSPMPVDMPAVLRDCRGMLDGEVEPARIDTLLGEPTCDGYWFGRAGMDGVSGQDVAAQRSAMRPA